MAAVSAMVAALVVLVPMSKLGLSRSCEHTNDTMCRSQSRQQRHVSGVGSDGGADTAVPIMLRVPLAPAARWRQQRWQHD